MSCCGKNRRQFYSEQQVPAKNNNFTLPANHPGPAGKFFSGQATLVCFEYIGRTSLTVTGAVSGKKYHFNGPGSQVIVDPRDRASVRLVPNLKQVFI